MDSSTEDYVLDKECYISTEYSTALTDYLCQCEKKLQDKELNEQLPLDFLFLDCRRDTLKNGEVIFLTSKSNSPRIDFAETCIYNIANRFLEKAEKENDKQCKNLAVSFNVPILVLSQLNRGVENRADKRPLMSDLFSLSKDLSPVDKILFLYREYYYLLYEEPKKYSKETIAHFEFRMERWEKECRDIQNECEIIIAENKNGKMGTVKCFYDLSYGKFDNLEHDDEYLPEYIG